MRLYRLILATRDAGTLFLVNPCRQQCASDEEDDQGDDAQPTGAGQMTYDGEEEGAGDARDLGGNVVGSEEPRRS